MTTLKNIEVNTWKYQASHGKTPRGFGMWMFNIGGTEYMITPAANYADAVRSAKMIAKSLNYTIITVLP